MLSTHLTRDRLNHEGRNEGEVRPESVEHAIRLAHKVFGSAGVKVSPAKVARLAREFVTASPPCSFREFLARNAGDQSVARRMLVGFDPTGNTAAANVDRERAVVAHG